jgi:hypothetical protein
MLKMVYNYKKNAFSEKKTRFLINNRNCLVVTRYSGFGTRNCDILCLKLSKTPIIAFRIPNSQSRLTNNQ